MCADCDSDMLQHATRFLLALGEKRQQRQGKIVYDVVDLAAAAPETGGGRSVSELGDFAEQSPRQVEGE
ncbi:hypothetical protein D9M72_345770 [compost metagenome]